MNIRLCKMTKLLCRQYMQGFRMDPDLFLDMANFKEYEYSDEKSDAHVDRYAQLGRVYLAVMLGDRPIGEVILTNIDYIQKCCTLGIHLQNDSVKNKGFGTQAEILALDYAFNIMNMEIVYADAIHKNRRSQHVMEKVGFCIIGVDDQFIYYQCEKRRWKHP